MSGIETDATGNVTALVSRDASGTVEERHEADAVIFAVSIAGRDVWMCTSLNANLLGCPVLFHATVVSPPITCCQLLARNT